MKKPVFSYSNTLFTLSWILTLPILIDICTACTLFSFWIVWIFYFAVLLISAIRIVHGIRQKCYKFCWGLIGQLLAGAAILIFFQLSFNRVIETPLSDPVTPDIVDITNPIHPDSARIVGASCPISDQIRYEESRQGDSVKVHHDSKMEHPDKKHSTAR